MRTREAAKLRSRAPSGTAGRGARGSSPSARMESRWALPCSRPPPKGPARLPGPPPGGTAAPCGCGSIGRHLRSHTCRGLPTHPRVSRLDTVTTWSNERVGSHGCQGEIRIWGAPTRRDPCPTGPEARLCGAGPVLLPQPGPPTEHCAAQDGRAAATTTLSAHGVAPAHPSVSELKGLQRRLGPTSSCHERRVPLDPRTLLF